MPTLDEQINELEDTIDKSDKVEAVVEAEETLEEAKEEVETAKEEVAEVVEKAEVKEPEKTDKTPLSPAEAYAIREAKRLQKENEDLKAAAIAKPKEEVKDTDPAPDAAENPIEYLAWENRQLKKGQEELIAFKNQFETSQAAQQREMVRVQAMQADAALAEAHIPDLAQGIDHMYETLKKAVSQTSPTATPQQVDAFVRDKMNGWADHYASQGMNRAQALYLLSQQKYEYKKEEPKAEPTKQARASLETVEKNKSKSAHGLGTGSTKSNVITPEAFAKMSVADMEANMEELQNAGFM